MYEFPDLQLLEGWLGCMLVKREGNGTDVWSLFRYITEQIRHIVGKIEFLRQCDDVAAFAQPLVEPQVAVSVHFE